LGDDRKASLDESKAQAALCLGQALERLQHSDWDQAVSLATEAIRLDSSQPNSYVRRGVAYLSKNEPAIALADFNYALDELPSLPSLPSTIRALVEEKRAQAWRALGKFKPVAGAEAPSAVSYSGGAVDFPERRKALEARTGGEPERPSAKRVAARAMILSAISFASRATSRSSTGESGSFSSIPSLSHRPWSSMLLANFRCQRTGAWYCEN